MLERKEWGFSKRAGDSEIAYRVVLVKLMIDSEEHWIYQTIVSAESEKETIQVKSVA